MAAKKVGTLIKEARTGAGLTQEQLAKKVDGLTASDISKAERGEKDLTQAQLKAIAKATGVTQASLLNAPKGGASASGGKKPAATGGKTSSASSGSVKLTAAEKKLLTAYRKADEEKKAAALKLLEGEEEAGEGGNLLNGLLEGALGLLTGKN